MGSKKKSSPWGKDGKKEKHKGAFPHDKKRWHLASKRALVLEKSKNQRRFSPRQEAMAPGEQKSARLGEEQEPKALFSTARSDGTWRAKERSPWRRARTKGAFLHGKKRWHLAR